MINRWTLSIAAILISGGGATYVFWPSGDEPEVKQKVEAKKTEKKDEKKLDKKDEKKSAEEPVPPPKDSPQVTASLELVNDYETSASFSYSGLDEKLAADLTGIPYFTHTIDDGLLVIIKESANKGNPVKNLKIEGVMVDAEFTNPPSPQLLERIREALSKKFPVHTDWSGTGTSQGLTLKP